MCFAACPLFVVTGAQLLPAQQGTTRSSVSRQRINTPSITKDSLLEMSYDRFRDTSSYVVGGHLTPSTASRDDTLGLTLAVRYRGMTLQRIPAMLQLSLSSFRVGGRGGKQFEDDSTLYLLIDDRDRISLRRASYSGTVNAVATLEASTFVLSRSMFHQLAKGTRIEVLFAGTEWILDDHSVRGIKRLAAVLATAPSP